MAAFAVALVNTFAFWHGICGLDSILVVTVAAATPASLEILGIIQLIVYAVAFLYIAHKGVAPNRRVVTAVVGVF